jgi:hypothetical protein
MLQRIAKLLKMQPPASTNQGLLFASGLAKPDDGTKGYQTGCLFQNTAGGAGTAAYINTGDYSSCLFVAVEADDDAAITGPVTITGALEVIGITTLDADLNVSETITSATPAQERLIHSVLTLTPATSLAIAGNSSLAAMRGELVLTTGKSISAGFLYGAQGKIILDGATVAVGSDHVAGVYAQMSMAGATLTSGHIAPLISSLQNTVVSSNVNGIYVENATGNAINSVLQAVCTANYAFDLSKGSGNFGVAQTGITSLSKGLPVKIDGVVYYIPLCTGNS